MDSNFNPTSNVTLEGVHAFDSVTIPVGVTVTVTGELTLNVSGDVTIAGSLIADCVRIVVNGQAAMTVTGTVSNVCSTLPAGDPPTLTLVSDGDLVFDGASIRSSGDVEVKNDPTLAEADFPADLVAAGGLAPAQTVRVFEIKNSSEFVHPGSARDGSDEDGENGRRGARFTFLSRGDLVVNSSSIDGQDGGSGGSQTNQGDGNRSATGGDGGDGGDVKLFATRQVILQTGTRLKSGDGGPGGSATATSTGGGGARAGSATAEGGDGGEAGLLRATGSAGITILADVVITIGDGGDGGAAAATGATGAICSDGHGQHGGHATATGGNGADSPEGRLRLTGNVSGAPGLGGANAGDGGNATATAGNGLAGQNCTDCKDGGDGGDSEATGGDGGDALLRNLANQVVGRGGDGGSASMSSGNGAVGSDCCDAEDIAGGDGGAGGNTDGSDGEPGTGEPAGNARGVTISNAGNGADGGRDSGGGGGAGTDGSQSNGNKSVQNSFTPGDAADPCPPPPPTGDQIVAAQIFGGFSVTETIVACPVPPLDAQAFNFVYAAASGSLSPGASGTLTANIVHNGTPFQITGSYDDSTGRWIGEGSHTFSNGITEEIRITGNFRLIPAGNDVAPNPFFINDGPMGRTLTPATVLCHRRGSVTASGSTSAGSVIFEAEDDGSSDGGGDGDRDSKSSSGFSEQHSD